MSFESTTRGWLVGLVGALMFTVGVGCSGAETGGSGVATSTTRVASRSFHEIEMKQVGAKIVLDPQATGTEILIQGDSNFVPLVRTRVDGDGKLVVDLEDNDIRPSVPLEIVVRVPRLTKVRAESNAVVDIDSTRVPNAPLKLEGWSESRITARGTASDVEIDLAGEAEVDARNLVANNVEVDAAGSATAYVCVTGKLDVDLAGSARTMYTCHPRDIDKDLAGSSQLLSF